MFHINSARAIALDSISLLYICSRIYSSILYIVVVHQDSQRTQRHWNFETPLSLPLPLICMNYSTVNCKIIHPCCIILRVSSLVAGGGGISFVCPLCLSLESPAALYSVRAGNDEVSQTLFKASVLYSWESLCLGALRSRSLLKSSAILNNCPSQFGESENVKFMRHTSRARAFSASNSPSSCPSATSCSSQDPPFPAGTVAFWLCHSYRAPISRIIVPAPSPIRPERFYCAIYICMYIMFITFTHFISR